MEVGSKIWGEGQGDGMEGWRRGAEDRRPGGQRDRGMGTETEEHGLNQGGNEDKNEGEVGD